MAEVPINSFNSGLSSGIYEFVQKEASTAIAKVSSWDLHNSDTLESSKHIFNVLTYVPDL